jgi:hypothetical protein
MSPVLAAGVVGRGVDTGFLPVEEVRAIAREGLARLPLDGRRVLVLIPTGTRTMPMPLLCGPVFPHEVVGFSGGTMYLFPGIAGPEIVHFTHWLGAPITNYHVIGTKATPVHTLRTSRASGRTTWGPGSKPPASV